MLFTVEALFTNSSMSQMSTHHLSLTYSNRNSAFFPLLLFHYFSIYREMTYKAVCVCIACIDFPVMLFTVGQIGAEASSISTCHQRLLLLSAELLGVGVGALIRWKSIYLHRCLL